MDTLITYYKEVLAIIGGLSSLISVFIVAFLKVKETKIKEKELSLKITEDIQKELYAKKIKTYQELYHHYILYNNEDYQIGRLIDDIERDENGGVIQTDYRYIEEYEVKMKAVDKILETIKSNIFYISDELIVLYSQLHIEYNKTLTPYYENHIQKYYNYSTIDEEQKDLNLIKKVVYENNKVTIVNIMLTIMKDLTDLKQNIKL